VTIWDPERYLAFADHRLRPALELLSRVANDTASTVVDLGCGPGNITPYLQTRWPQADYIGVDNSQEMLAVASAAHPGATWVNADAGTWISDQPVDVLYSNAALHWVDDHARTFEQLVAQLTAGGTIAVQMPANFDEPTHTTITDVVRSTVVCRSRGTTASCAGARPELVSRPALSTERKCGRVEHDLPPGAVGGPRDHHMVQWQCLAPVPGRSARRRRTPGVPGRLWQRRGAALPTPAWRRDTTAVQTSFCGSHDQLTYFVQIG
jgi:SAM-dependent methyltransferase